MKNRLKLAAASLLAALCLSLTLPAVRAWASVEGSYIYHQFVLRGPAYFFSSPVGGAQGIIISTNAYTGASQSGVPTVSGTALQIIGAQTTAARTACSSTTEGQLAYDFTVHSMAWCNGTSWYKLVDSGSSYSTSGDYWTAY